MATTIFIAVAFSLLFLSPNSLAFNDSNLDSIADSYFLKDVLKAISVRQRWNLDEIRVSSLQVGKARVGRSQRYEFRVRVGESVWMLKLSDEISSWRKVKKRGEIGSDLVRCASSKAVLKGFELEGPAEIRVDGDDELSMHFPLNTTLTGLKRVLVAEGITVQVKGAQEAIVHPSNFELPVKTRSATNPARQFWPFEYSMCTPLLPVQISGFASLVAYRTSNPNAHIESALLSRGVIQLLPDKCYSEHMSKTPRAPIQSLSSRLYILENLVSSFFGERILNDRVPLLLNAKLTASILVRFKLEIEREVGEDDAYLGTFADWRTKPTVERVWFEVVARVESDRLKPMVLKKFEPFVAVDTAPWSTLTSNVSFTHFPSALVPPESLTLDVKW